MSERRYQGCTPTILCGQKVWIAERGGYGGSLTEVWIHFSPWIPAAIYLKGSSLTEGTPESNREYLEGIVRDRISGHKMSAKMERVWDEDMAEIAA